MVPHGRMLHLGSGHTQITLGPPTDIQALPLQQVEGLGQCHPFLKWGLDWIRVDATAIHMPLATQMHLRAQAGLWLGKGF
jgi:hypothetical protein